MMSLTIGERDARARFSGLLDRAGRGEPFTIT